MDLSGKAKEMMSYLPQYWHDMREMKQILHTEGIEFEQLTDELKNLLMDAFIMSSSEKRVSQWEKQLKLPSIGTLQERRIAILQYFATNLKLSPTVIKSLVASIYGEVRSTVTFADSEIKVLITPLPERQNDEIDCSILMKQLEIRKPCHIGASVERFICSWQDVRDGRLRSWGDFKTDMKTWGDILMYIPR